MPRFKKRRLHGELVQERGIKSNYPQNQSYVGSSGQTLTTNVSMTLFVTKPMYSVAALHLVPRGFTKIGYPD